MITGLHGDNHLYQGILDASVTMTLLRTSPLPCLFRACIRASCSALATRPTGTPKTDTTPHDYAALHPGIAAADPSRIPRTIDK